ncbi:glycosyltransferase family 4 protein [Nocardioides anomalus]|uniref:Glycosyltransferase family 4 protein n=1 Tax=Nocardioides anomalus TaxID=2712223 RepID=A0A6G6WEI8_9ACTN|nr:glycosyltransferase family 4 protein [Nocardioides anomalus]QIG43652.1 glycosyltransferase family 4 protein [Nocardioides anomalus]
MRIIHVTDCYLPRLGGIELHVRDLAARQRAQGHEVTVVTSTPGESAPGLWRAAPGDAWLRSLCPDVVQAHVSIISPFALGSARRASRAGVPTVATVHSLWTHVGPLPELACELWGMRRWPVTWAAVSDRAATPVRALLDVPVHVVPNAVDLDEWIPAPEQPHPGPPHVVSVMRLTGVKRALPLLDILRGAAARTDFSATVIGDGPQRAAMERHLRRHRLGDRVRLTGTLDRAAIRRELATASVFLAPAHRESFGIAALEARASGVPVLASAHSGVGTFIRHGREGLLARDDHDLAAQLVRLLVDHDLRDRLAAHNRRVRPAFGWPEALARHEELYAAARVTAASTEALAG